MRNTVVEYRPLISWIFNAQGIRGWLFNRALHMQHRRLYCYDCLMERGIVPLPPLTYPASDSTLATSRQFLEMVHWDEKPSFSVPGGRLYTYVITLQGEWRFTETGPEFAVDLLSKHSMHSDAAREVAFAGEFFVRRRRGRRREQDTKESGSWEELEVAGYGTSLQRSSASEESLRMSRKPSHPIGGSRNPRHFVLIIDNDSGTYRPENGTLYALREYLERNLPGLKVQAMASDDEKLKQWKEEQKPKKEVLKARKLVQLSSSSSSVGSSDIELDEEEDQSLQ